MAKKTIKINVPTDLVVDRLFDKREIKIIALTLIYDKEGILMQDVANILEENINVISKSVGAIAPFAIIESVMMPKSKGVGAGATPKYLQIMKDDSGEFLNKELIDEYIVSSLSTNFHCRSVIEEAELYFKNK
jgi:hypothetical protein